MEYDGFVSYQVARMTSSQVITHLFLPRLKWEWHHSSDQKQVLSLLWEQTGGIWIPLLSQCYCCTFVWHRSKYKHGEGLDRAWRNRGHCEDGKQGKVLHWISFVVPWRYGLTSERHFTCSVKNPLTSLFLETRRSSENDTQSCDVPGFLKLGWSFKQLPKVRGSVHFEMAENGLLVPGARFLMCDWFMSCFYHSFFQSCLTWSMFRISTCCCLSSHVMALSHMVGHSEI